jgi:hypothetical protein
VHATDASRSWPQSRSRPTATIDEREAGAVAASRREHAAVIRLVRWSAEHPWRAVGGWIVFVALCVVCGGMIGTRQQSNADEAVGEWGRAERIVDHGNFTDPARENVLVTARSGVRWSERAPRRPSRRRVGGSRRGTLRRRSMPEPAVERLPVASGTH